MIVMPNFAIRATWPGLLTEDADERLLDLVPGTVVVHPLEGGTEVAVPVTQDDIHSVTRSLEAWTALLAQYAGDDPESLSIDPLEEV